MSPSSRHYHVRASDNDPSVTAQGFYCRMATDEVEKMLKEPTSADEAE